MERTSRRHAHNGHDFSGDISKIREAFVDATKSAADLAGQAWSDSLEDIRSRSANVQKNVRTYITKRPLRAVIAATVTGAVLGYFFHK